MVDACEVTGDLPRARAILTVARGEDRTILTSLAGTVAVASVLVHGDGDVDTAHRLLVPAIEDHLRQEGHDLAVLHAAVELLAVICCYGGRAELWEPYLSALGRLGASAPPLSRLGSAATLGLEQMTSESLGELDRLAATRADDASALLSIAVAALPFDRIGPCRPALARLAEAGRRGGAVLPGMHALLLIGVDAVLVGRWPDARAAFSEMVGVAERFGYPLIAMTGYCQLAWLAALEGDERELADRLSRVERWAIPRGIRSLADLTRSVRALNAVGRGEFRAGFWHAAAAGPPGRFGPFRPTGTWLCFELVESALRTGRVEVARAHAAALAATGAAGWSARWEVVVATCTALAEDDDASVERLQEVLDRGGACPSFERARGQLVLGVHLRRHDSASRSREYLSAAVRTFTDLGALPWARRATAELEATAAVRRHRATRASAGSGDPAAELSPRQRAIAECAAGGASTKEIAERLGLSPRTVSNHLAQIYPKLGIGSRAALRDALGPRADRAGAERR